MARSVQTCGRMQQEIEESLPQLVSEEEDVEASTKRWEDITCANSLADVARLHCGVDMSKEIRNDFMTHTRTQIFDGIQDYFEYCSNDVAVTHAVYSKVFPDFLKACPSPVSFAGVMTMGSSFLTVNEEWGKYLAKAEGFYMEAEEKIKRRLVEIAEDAKDLAVGEAWKDDVWLNQMDWTPKTPGKSRGIAVVLKSTRVSSILFACASILSHFNPQSKSKRKPTSNDSRPEWFRLLEDQGPFSERARTRILPLLFRISCDSQPLQYSLAEGWTYLDASGTMRRPHGRDNARVVSLLGKSVGLKELKKGRLTTPHGFLVEALCNGDNSPELKSQITDIAKELLANEAAATDDPWASQLSWKRQEGLTTDTNAEPEAEAIQESQPTPWPKWYWDLTKPKKDAPPGSVDITVRSRLAPLLLRLSWSNWPLFHSREHGWIFRVPRDAGFETRQKKLTFYDPSDAHLQDSILQDGYSFYKLPHKDGDSANVGSPFGKTFVNTLRMGR